MKVRRIKANNRQQVNKKAVFFTALAAGILGGAYLLIRKLRVGRNDSEEASFMEESSGKVINAPKNVISAGTFDSFPLRAGSRGQRVKVLQEALKVYSGNESLNVDGIFGRETLKALQRAGLSNQVNENNFNSITAKRILAIDSGSLAERLHKAALLRKSEEVINLLKEIQNVAQYSQVNERYKLISEQKTFVTSTIVTDLLSKFKLKPDVRARMMDEFTRIGLKHHSNGKWSLSGERWNEELITIGPTYVIDWMGNRVPVKDKTILGREKWNINGMTFFQGNDEKLYRVPSKDIQYVS